MTIILTTSIGADAAARDVFFSLIEDLPVMPGLSEDVEAGMVFDKPEGRIVTAVAQGRVPKDAPTRYYDEVLPQLGWQKQSGGDWRRDEETLRAAISEDAGTVRLTITISPAGPE